jgi:alkylated DNA repair dioxygenase AlkB
MTGSWLPDRQRIELPDADVTLWPRWLPRDRADALLAALLIDIPWSVHRIRMFGRLVDSPRLSCWIGDPGTGYTYSGTRFEPQPWPPALLELREPLERVCAARFNSVLANLYRDGNDSMGWHSDDEPELGERPVIASLSLGAERRFRLRRKLPRGTPVAPRDTVGLALPHGSLLCMAGETQHHYRHDLPKTRAPVGARINLTFRWIEPSPAGPPRSPTA